MQKLKQTLCIALLFLGLSVSAQDNRPVIRVEQMQGPTPWSNLDINDGANQFQFAIVTDRTGGLRPGIFLDGVKKLNLLQPEFVMSVGDLIEGYTEDTVELNRQWKEFNGFINELQMPFFYIPGNHDITNAVMDKKWKSLFGPTYYHFVYKDVLFLCLNSEDEYRGAGRGTINTPQYEYVKKVLADNPNVKWTLVFMHQPLWMQEDPKRWGDVEKLLTNRKHSVFVGHIHRYIKFERNNGKYFTLATTGGGSSLRGPALGEFDHVVWVTMTEKGPVMANLMLDGIWDENVTTEAQSNFARPLADGMPIQVNPLLVEKDEFAGENLKIKLTNDSDVPMMVDLKFDAHLDLFPDFAKKSLTLQPNSVEIIDAKISTQKNIKSEEFSAIELHADITYQGESSPALNIQKKRILRPEKIQKIKKVNKKIKLDGDLQEWGQLPLVSSDEFVDRKPFDHQGAKDGSFKFGVSYDETHIYVAVDVTDNEILTNEKNRAYFQDGLFMEIDARPERISTNASGGRSGTILLIQNPFGKVNDKIYRGERLPEGFKAVTRRTAKGYQSEVAIPLSYVKKMQGSDDWQGLRLNVAIQDYDQDYQHQTMIPWRPSWRTEQNFIGSGIFRKTEEL